MEQSLSAIPAWERPSSPKSSVGAPVRRTSACCSLPPWTCSTTCSLLRSITRSFANYGSTPSPRCSSLTSLATYRSISKAPISFTRSSPRATVTNDPPSLPPTQPSPTGATSSTTPPSRPQSPTGWWRTPRSSCLVATAFAKATGIRIRRLPNKPAGCEHAPRCDDIPRRGVGRLTPQRRCHGGTRELRLPPLGSLLLIHVQLQRQSSRSALADGMPPLCRVRHERRFDSTGLPAV